MRTRADLVVRVLLVAVVSACTSGDSNAPTPNSSNGDIEACQEPPEAEQTLPDSDFTLTVAPNPIPAGAEADLFIEVAEDAPEHLIDAPEGEVITGAGARLRCWDGSAWVDTHQLLKNGFGPDNQPAAIALGPDVTVTIPTVGLSLHDQPYTIVIPDIPPGVYRIEDSVIVGSSERPTYSLIELRGAG
jgi:uncharacterized lipoprotein YbaY